MVQSDKELFDAAAGPVAQETRQQTVILYEASVASPQKVLDLWGFVMRSSSVTIILYLKSSFWTQVEAECPAMNTK